MNNINKMIGVFDKRIEQYPNLQVLIYQCIFKKCINSILRNYYAGSFVQVIDSNKSMDYIYTVTDACESFVNKLPLFPEDSDV